MEGLFKELPENVKPILNDLTESFKSFRSGDVTHIPELFEAHEWKGYRFPPAFVPETARKYFEEVDIEEDTVFIFSYPKTGTNWTAEIIRQIIYGGDEKLNTLSKNLPQLLTFLEVWKPTKFELIKYLSIPRRVYSSHLPAELVDFEKMKKAKAKIIIPIRNPKDQAVSWFHFSQHHHFDAVRDEISSEWSQFFQDYIQGKHRTVSKLGEWYPEYLLSWYKYKDEDNVMFVYFEDLKKDPEGSIRKIAEFLDVKLSADRVSAVARDSSFGVMKKNQENEDSETAKVLATMNMLRKGQSGDWKNTFTVAQSELMDKIIAEKLGNTDIKFRYQ